MADEQSFDEFYDASFRRVVGQVYAMTGRLSESEDSVQEAFARAWQNWDRISAYDEPESWVRSVAFRLSISAWRKAINRLTAHRRQATVQDELHGGLSPDRLAIVTALRQIPPELRQVIVLHHLLDRSVEQICAETGLPAGTVKTRLARGRKALAPHLSEFAGEVGGGTTGTGSAKPPRGAAAWPGRAAGFGRPTGSGKQTGLSRPTGSGRSAQSPQSMRCGPRPGASKEGAANV